MGAQNKVTYSAELASHKKIAALAALQMRHPSLGRACNPELHSIGELLQRLQGLL